ncbi:hypothetical protein GCM10028787_33010 [Brachybacterium horti]
MVRMSALPRPAGALRRLHAAIPTRQDLATALPRPNRTWAVRVWWLLVIGWVIWTGPVAYADDPINVTGPGGLFFIPDLSGDGERLFWEKYIWVENYGIHSEANWNDPLLGALGALANGLMYLLVVFGATIASVTGWLFSMTTIDGMATAVGNVMGASAEGTLGWLFPSMLVLGGIVAYTTRNKGGEGMVGNLLWLVVAGTALILTTMHAPLLVSSVENVRVVGADSVATMSQGATVNGETPIVYASPEDDELEGSPADIAARKNIDAMWRTLIVTPWCLAEFGSIEACEQYGTSIVTTTGDDRKEATEAVKTAQKGSSTETWLGGMDTNYAIARVVILLIGLVVAVVFTLFVLFAALTATYALVMTYLLLIVGPLFLAMGCVPGAPRRWVINWAKQVVVQLLMSLIAFTIFSAVLSLIAILFAATAQMGWMLSALLTMTALVAGVALRGRLEAIFQVGSDGGSGIGKYLLARKALSMMRLPNLGGRRGPKPSPRTRSRDSAPPEPPADSGGGEGPTPPALPAGRGAPPALPPARQPRALPAARPKLEAAPVRDERSRSGQLHLRATPALESQRTAAPQSTGTAPQHELPAGATRHQLAAGTSSPRETSSTRTASTGSPATTAPAGQAAATPRPAGKTVRTSPAADVNPRRAQQVLSGEVLSPESSAPAPAEPSTPYRARRRTQARVRYTRPDLPDAPRLHAPHMPRRTEYMSTAQSTEPPAPRSRPVPSDRGAAHATSPRPRFRAPSYQ